MSQRQWALHRSLLPTGGNAEAAWCGRARLKFVALKLDDMKAQNEHDVQVMSAPVQKLTTNLQSH